MQAGQLDDFYTVRYYSLSPKNDQIASFFKSWSAKEKKPFFSTNYLEKIGSKDFYISKSWFYGSLCQRKLKLGSNWEQIRFETANDIK